MFALMLFILAAIALIFYDFLYRLDFSGPVGVRSERLVARPQR
jgi:hypothetical protein